MSKLKTNIQGNRDEHVERELSRLKKRNPSVVKDKEVKKPDLSDFDKLAIAFINHKGGVGKTTTAYLLTEIALSLGLEVTAVDLDPQGNLNTALDIAYAANPERFKNLVRSNEITDTGDLIVIDCPPALNDLTAQAIDYADIILIPLLPDVFSVSNVGLVYKFGLEHEKSLEQMAVVKIGFDARVMSEMVNVTIDSREYVIAGNLPKNVHIPLNIATGRLWNRMSVQSRKPYFRLFYRTVNAYRSMIKGDFENAWG